MTDALKALIPFVFRTLGLHRIEAACLTANDASKRSCWRVRLPARKGWRAATC